jgi:hypothetical protein
MMFSFLKENHRLMSEKKVLIEIILLKDVNTLKEGENDRGVSQRALSCNIIRVIESKKDWMKRSCNTHG